MNSQKLPDVFVSHACDVLAETYTGLSGTEIVKYCNAYAVDFGVNIPITSADFGQFGSTIPNKRTALYKNLIEFNGQQQFVIIKDLTELPKFENNQHANAIRRILFERYSSFSVTPVFENNSKLTGWERVDRSIEEMKNRYEASDTEEKYQAIGMIGRETLISIAQEVFVKDKHPSVDNVDISPTDAKRMLEAYLTFELKDESKKVVKYAKSAVDLSNQLTNDRNATKRTAGICLLAVSSIANIVRYVDETSFEKDN